MCVYAHVCTPTCVCVCVCACAFVCVSLFVSEFSTYFNVPTVPESSTETFSSSRCGRARVCVCVYECVLVCVYVCVACREDDFLRGKVRVWVRVRVRLSL